MWVLRIHQGKLVPKEVGPFKVLQIRTHKVTVDFNRIHNVLSSVRIKLVKTSENVRLVTEVERHDVVPLEADDTKDEYVVKRIVRH